MSKKEKFTVAQITTALESSAGILGVSAKKLKCHTTTVRNYIDRHDMQPLLDEIVESTLDMAEAELIEARKQYLPGC